MDFLVDISIAKQQAFLHCTPQNLLDGERWVVKCNGLVLLKMMVEVVAELLVLAVLKILQMDFRHFLE